MTSVTQARLAVAAQKLSSAGELAFAAFYKEGETRDEALTRMRADLAIAAHALGMECVERGDGK